MPASASRAWQSGCRRVVDVNSSEEYNIGIIAIHGAHDTIGLTLTYTSGLCNVLESPVAEPVCCEVARRLCREVLFPSLAPTASVISFDKPVERWPSPEILLQLCGSEWCSASHVTSLD